MTFHSDHNYNARMTRLLSYILFSRFRYRLLIFLVSFLATVFGILAPFFQKEFVDTLLSHNTFLIWSHSFHPLLLAFLFSLLGYVFYQYTFYLGTQEALFMQRDLSEKMYQKTLELRSDTLGKTAIGEVVALYATDIQASTVLLDQSIPGGFSILFPLILAPVSLIYLYDLPPYSTLLLIFCMIFVNFYLGLRQSRFFYKFKHLAQERVGLVNEWIQNIRTLRILGWTHNFEKRIFQKREEETINRLSMVTNGQIMNSLGSSFTYIINIAAIYTLTKIRPTTPGELLSLLWILGVYLARPFRQMPWFFTFILDGLTSIKRLEFFFKLENKNQRTEPLKPISNFNFINNIINSSSILEIKNLNLKIDESSILKNISFEVLPKEFIAIVGEVGAGKSQLLNSLLMETGAQFGNYKLFSTQSHHLTTEQIRSCYSYVPQEGFVVNANLRDNICFDYDSPKSHDLSVYECLNSSSFDLNLEDKNLDTEIGERGVNLSGGQKQRVGLARAAFFDRPIILLDDCLSAVDVETENRIIKNLILGKWKDKTKLLVTHRLSILPYTNRIFYMENGQIKAQGTYEELKKICPEFIYFINKIPAKTIEVSHE